jgi:hypothetical protein
MSSDTRESLKDFLGRDPKSTSKPASEVDDGDNISLSSLTNNEDAGSVLHGVPLLNANTNNDGYSLLGDYVNYISEHFYKESGNEFFIEGGKKHRASAPTTRGSEVPEYTNRQGADSTFIYQKDDADVSVDKLGSTLAEYSNSGKWDVPTSGGTTIQELINKTGRGDSSAPNGNHIYDNIPPDGYFDEAVSDTADPVKSSFAMLQAHNRFSVKGEKEYGYANIEDGADNDKEFASVQTTPGSYNSGANRSFKFKFLKDVGIEILKNASHKENAKQIVFAGTVSPRVVGTSPFGSDGKFTDDAGNTFSTPSGAFEEAQQAQSIKKSFTSPSNKFIDENNNIIPVGSVSYFSKKIKEFRDLLGTEGERDNNSVYTVNSYADSVDEALSNLFDENATDIDPFFANIANSLTSIIEAEASPDTPGHARITSELAGDKEVAKKFLDIIAVLGDVMLELNVVGDDPIPGGGGSRLSGGIWDVDTLEEGPATRISKSKTSSRGPNNRALAWRGSAMPSIYNLPASVVRSMQNMGSVSSQNPMKGMLAGGLVDKTYMSAGFTAAKDLKDSKDQVFSMKTAGTNKIPKMLVEEIENRLDAEYVPFYFHDLRTNEIISFHAFLSDLTDSFKASYESNDGFGRMDPVQIYKNTTRNIGFSFKVVATSEQDFDEMWFKINKLITLLYPQWSEGEQLEASIDAKKSTFTRPFSQVPVGSPMIRLRIGDVIKSNYSRFNLSRIFGSGHPGTNIHPEHVAATSLIGLLSEAAAGGSWTKIASFNDTMQEHQVTATKFMLKAMMVAIGSPLQMAELIPEDSIMWLIAKDAVYGLLTPLLEGGFVNPTLGFAIDRLRDPDGDEQTLAWAKGKDVGPRVGDAVMLKPSLEKYYLSPKSGVEVPDTVAILNSLHGLDSKNTDYAYDQVSNKVDKIRISRHVKCRVVGRTPHKGKTYFNVVAVSGDGFSLHSAAWPKSGELHALLLDNGDKIKGRVFTVTNNDLVLDPDYLFDAFLAILLDPVSGIMDKAQDMIDMMAGSLGISTDNINLFTTTFEDFMHPVNNSITKSFETTSGRGLAGFISSMDFKWIDNDMPWETKFGGRAPKVCNITVKFEPIHDIAPGLDSDGFNRAPTHNVGSIMNNIAGDPYEKGFEAAKKSFDKAASGAFVGIKKGDS